MRVMREGGEGSPPGTRRRRPGGGEDRAPGRPSPAAIGKGTVPGEGVARRLRSARGGRPLPGTKRQRPKHEVERGGQEAVRSWSRPSWWPVGQKAPPLRLMGRVRCTRRAPRGKYVARGEGFCRQGQACGDRSAGRAEGSLQLVAAKLVASWPNSLLLHGVRAHLRPAGLHLGLPLHGSAPRDGYALRAHPMHPIARSVQCHIGSNQRASHQGTGCCR